MKYSSAEVKSGILISVSVLLLLALTFAVGQYMVGESRDYQIRFGYVAGLEEGAPVYFAGREVGKVDEIRILPGKQQPVVVAVRIAAEILLREDTAAFIDTLGLMGEKFVELTPGTEKAPFLEPGEVIAGTDPIPVHVMVRKMNLLAGRMDEMMIELQPLVTQTNGLLQGQKENLSLIVANLHETSINVRDMTHDLKYRPWRLLRKD